MHHVIVQHRIPFHDVDIMNIVWHGHYLKYFEIARTNFMQSLDLDWPRLKEMGVAMPVVSSAVEHRVPVQYNELISIQVSCENLWLPYMLLKFEVFGSDQVLRAWGSTKQVYMTIEPYDLSFVQPQVIVDQIKSVRLNPLSSGVRQR